MATPEDAATRAARARLYLQRAQTGVVLNRTFAFYSGKPTTPNSFTGNLVLGASSGGPAANLIDGAGPPIVAPIPCDVPLISLVEVGFEDDIIVVVTYANPDPETDIYVVFAPGVGASFGPLEVTPGPGANQVTLVFPGGIPSGIYTLKIMRATDPTHCFSTKANAFTVEGAVCVLDAGAWTFPGGAPFPPSIPPGPVATQIVGSGFLSCTIDVAVEKVFGPGPPTLPVSLLVVIDDNTLTFTVDGSGAAIPSTYSARVFCTDIIDCEDFADTFITWDFA